MRPVVNRILIGLAGLVLVCAGGAVLATGAGLPVPSWWPWYGPGDVLLSDADRARWREEGWWWPTVIAVLAVLVLLALWWLLAQVRRSRLAEVLVDSGDGDGALLRGRALESVMTAEAESLDGVSQAAVTLAGRRTAPKARLRLRLEPHAAPAETLTRLVGEVLTHAEQSTGLAPLPAEARLRASRHGAERVT